MHDIDSPNQKKKKALANKSIIDKIKNPLNNVSKSIIKDPNESHIRSSKHDSGILNQSSNISEKSFINKLDEFKISSRKDSYSKNLPSKNLNESLHAILNSSKNKIVNIDVDENVFA